MRITRLPNDDWADDCTFLVMGFHVEPAVRMIGSEEPVERALNIVFLSKDSAIRVVIQPSANHEVFLILALQK